MAISADALFDLACLIVLGVIGFLLSRLLKTLDDNISELQAADKTRAEELAAFRLEIALFKQRLATAEEQVRPQRRPHS